MDDATFFAGLVPELAALARAHREKCERAGLNLVWCAGLRTWDEQIQAYTYGRARTPSGWVITDEKKVVTRALPDESPHCRGAAYDCAPLDPHEKIDWTRKDLFRAVAALAPDGLIWGGSSTFTCKGLDDEDHFELANWRAFPIVTTRPAPAAS